MKKVSIWASGGGSNARCIMEHLSTVPGMEVAVVVTNRAKSGVRDIAREYGIPDVLIGKDQLADQDSVLQLLSDNYDVDLIVLAGWLLLIPPYLVDAYRGRMINIHPSLLPKYGGPGMYGMHVHQAVHDSGDEVSGMTVHHVTEQYDEGGIILQARVALDPDDSPQRIAERVLQLEHRYYPIVVEELLRFPYSS